MSRIFVIPDTHFWHTAMIRYCGRPEDFTERIHANWSRVVRPADLVMHLGDVSLGRRDKLAGFLHSLPGTKVLVRGNHDPESSAFYRRAGFAAVCNSMTEGSVLFTHRPVPADALGAATINVCGHVHTFAPDVMEDLPNLGKHNYVLALEWMNYEPKLLTEVLAGKWHRADLHGFRVTKRIDNILEFSLTAEQYTAYMSSNGHSCPYCSIPVGDEPPIEHTILRVCGNCGLQWQDVLQSKTIVLIGDPESAHE